jgi:hypothetical protein
MHKASTDGARDRQCPRCKQFLRHDDFTERGICRWCEYDLGKPVQKREPPTRPEGESNNPPPSCKRLCT